MPTYLSNSATLARYLGRYRTYLSMLNKPTAFFTFHTYLVKILDIHLVLHNRFRRLVSDQLGVLEDADDVAHEGDAHVLQQLLVQVQQHAALDP